MHKNNNIKTLPLKIYRNERKLKSEYEILNEVLLLQHNIIKIKLCLHLNYLLY
ncbi:Conserved hypothetical protein [Clostridium neonatale]|nr:Conserved hypothetical protein [Clostridium neonatale]CAI3203121.1 Conserved hypothetical protein [Clostridium neonatale]CAI3209857.1 Conserved hypothetical protein [Clostridium neonatale]CAI3641026.1 Conserved hypothetical protein [Clostridium neonatale]